MRVNAKLTLKNKILPPLLPGFEHVTFRSRVWAQLSYPGLTLYVANSSSVSVMADVAFRVNIISTGNSLLVRVSDS